MKLLIVGSRSINNFDLILRPKYKLYGRAAPIKRNEAMVDLADKVIIIWDGASKGAFHTARYAEKKNIPVTVVLHSHQRT